MLLFGPNTAPNSSRIPPKQTLAAPGVRIPLAPPSIYGPRPVQGLQCRRDLELGCSHIYGLLVGRQMKPWALMDFRALRSADQSGGLSRPCVATEFGSAGPTGSPSASDKTPYATSARAGF